MRLLTATVFLALTGWTAGAADDAKDASKKLNGTYKVVAAISGGKPEAKAAEIGSVEIKDGVITIKAKRDEPAKFTLDPSKKPGHIEIMPDGDKSIPGIYQVKETDEGTELTIAFMKGKDAVRPKNFKGEGSSEVVLKLLRKKK